MSTDPQQQPQGILTTSLNNPTASSSSSSAAADPTARKARLVGPEIVQLPDPVDAESDDETDAEDDGATELGGEPRVRNKDSLKDIPDDTEVRLRLLAGWSSPSMTDDRRRAAC